MMKNKVPIADCHRKLSFSWTLLNPSFLNERLTVSKSISSTMLDELMQMFLTNLSANCLASDFSVDTCWKKKVIFC